MRPIKEVRLSYQCDQSLDKMTPRKGGRFCPACNKTVIDFRHKSREDLEKAMATRDAVCGIFDSSQLVHKAASPKRFYIKWIAAFLLTIGLSSLHKRLMAQNIRTDSTSEKKSSIQSAKSPVFGMMPLLPRYKNGGNKELQDFLKKHIHCPKEIDPGTIVVQFIVDTGGKVIHPKIINPCHPALDREILKAVKLLEFEPGIFGDKKMPVMYSLPVRFARK